jgi:alpha-beta hydrolase superfamily lysophospholipase
LFFDEVLHYRNSVKTMNLTQGEHMANKVSKKVFFMSGGFSLAGDLLLPREPTPPVVIGAHGLFADRRSPKQAALAEACNSAGLGYFRFDFRGCGESDGGPEEQCSFEARIRDLSKACQVVKARKDCGDRIALFGSSLGGAAACRVFSDVRASSIVVFAAPTASRCVLDAVERLEGPDKYPAWFHRNLTFDNAACLSKLSDILVFHGDADEVVPLSEAGKTYEAARSPKKMIVQKQGDHRMSDEAHQEEFVRLAVDWFAKGFERN